MRVVVQRVQRACVRVNDEVVGRIERGMSVLVGIGRDDTSADMDYIARKLLGLRLWPSAETRDDDDDDNKDNDKSNDSSRRPASGKAWCCSIQDIQGGILLISQFTLMHVLKGNKPDFHHAMAADEAKAMFDALCATLRRLHGESRVATGKFQHYMHIDQVMDGPVTLVLDSKNKT